MVFLKVASIKIREWIPFGRSAMRRPPSSLYPSHRLDFHIIRYNTASQIKKRQDDYCARAITEDWVGLGDFPEVLEWESLVDVLRGRVKVMLTNRFASKRF